MTNDKTFTQAQVDSMVAANRRKDRARILELEKQVGDFDTIKAAAHSRVAELEAQVQKITAERDAALGEAESIRAQNHEERCRHSFESLFEQAGGLTSKAARRMAAKIIAMDHSPEFNDEGDLVALTIDAQRIEGGVEALKQFLEGNDHLKRLPPPGPSPTGRPNGVSLRPAPKLEDADPVALVSEGLRHGQ